MESEGKTYLIYDKSTAGLHSYSNPLTVDITIEQLFNDKIEPYEGEEAVNFYNTKMASDPDYMIPKDLKLGIYNVYCFNFKKNNVDILITLISVDNKQLEEYYTEHSSVPQERFIVETCRFHQNYCRFTDKNKNIQKGTANTLDTRLKDIVDIALKPDSNVLDNSLNQQDFTKVKLHNYQLRTIKWMVDTEKNRNHCYYSNDAEVEIKLGRIFYDPFKKTFLSQDEKNKLVFTGGALIDEVGLGKTIESMMASILNPAKDIRYVRPGQKNIYSRATIVICPNQLAKQWEREFGKMIKKDKKLDVICLLTKNHFDKVSYLDVMDADFVIVSYHFLGNKNFLKEWLPKVSTNGSYMHGTSYSYAPVQKAFDELRLKYYNDLSLLTDMKPILPIINWHRVIIDEFHEPYTIDKYRFVMNIIPHFRGDYKWCMSGTPFDKGTKCLSKMLDFVTDYTNTIDTRIFYNTNVYEHMTKRFFRRSTKKSTEAEYKLKPLRERIIWLKFSQTERMMYNAYLADPTVDKFGTLMRQLCCHPNLADETKGILSNCKTLKDIEKMMVSHYKKAYEDAKDKVDKAEISILKLKKRKIVTIYKRQRKFLRQLDYKVKIVYPDFGLGPEHQMSDEEDSDSEDGDEEGGVSIKKLLKNEFDSDDDYDDSDSDKEEITVSEDNQSLIKSLVKNKWNKTPSATLEQIDDSINNWYTKLAGLNNILAGKKTTYTFFSNVMERVQKTAKKHDVSDSESGSDSDSDSDSYSSSDSDSSDDEDEELCGICMCPVESKDIGVTKCGHIFDYECLKSTIAQKPKCPMCSTGLTANQIYLISYEKKVKKPTGELKNKLELINKVGTKLANLIYYITSIPDHVIIFSQWDDLLRKVGVVLTEHGIKNAFCRGNVWQRDKVIREFNSKDDVRVIMLSSASAASGINLTKATKVILLDPVYGSYEFRKNTEWQAVGRAYRMGQMESVEIVRLIIKDSVEEDIYKMNKLEDAKSNSKLQIEEVNDTSLTLSNTQLKTIEQNIKKTKEDKERKEKEKRERKARREKKKEDEKKKKKVQKVKKIN